MESSLLKQQYRSTLIKYRKFTHRFQRHIRNHTFGQLSAKHRNRLLRTIERLKRRLTALQLQLKLGIAGASLCLAVGMVEEGLAQAPVTTGSEFQVNSYTTNFQRLASMAMDSDGDFVVAWESKSSRRIRPGYLRTTLQFKWSHTGCRISRKHLYHLVAGPGIYCHG